VRKSLLVLLLLLSACGVSVEDRTASTLPRSSLGLYDLVVRVEPASGGVGINSVNAVTSFGTFAMAPAGGLDWTAQVPLGACVNGFDVRYDAKWSYLLAGNTKRDPRAGVRQKWLTGPSPQGCSTQFGLLFTVDSTADLPDLDPGDGVCAATGNACTLRAAVMEANARRGQDRIELEGGTYVLTREGEEDVAAAGDLDVLDEVVIAGTGATTISAGETGERVFDVAPSGERVDLELRLLTVTDGRAVAGAGIRNRGHLQLFQVSIRDNQAESGGGGIFNDEGFVELRDTEVRDNRVTGNPGALGGGIFSQGASAAVVIRASSVIGNESSQHGGGILIAHGRFEMRDSTIADNRSGVHGAGLFANGEVNAKVRNVTITGNVADSDRSGAGSGGGIHRGCSGPGTFQLANSIVAQNQAVIGDDCNGTISSDGHNFLGTADGCFGLDATDIAGTDLSPQDPRLGPLSGGSSRSRRPLTDSPVLDAGNPDELNDERSNRCTHVDQRGTERPKGPKTDGRLRCDIGSVERD
jgi:CSLREA domain-containing protein